MSYLQQQEQHTVYIQRLATRMLNEHIYPSYQEAYKAARRILRDNDAITSITQLNRITSEITRTITPIYTQGYADLTADLNEFAIYEAGFQAALLESTAAVALSVPAEDKILRYINKSLMSLQSGSRATTGVWADFVKSNVNSNIAIYENVVKTGVARSQTIKEMVAELTRLTDGVIRSDAESLVRTGINHYATQSRLAMAADNKRVIAREVPITTFDNRRSAVCTSIQAKYGIKGWKAGESPIGYPAYHWNCRTTIGFLVDGQDELEGMRTAISGRKGDDAKEAYEKRKNDRRTTGKVKRRGRKDDTFFDPSQIRVSTQIDNWLMNQPDWYIVDNLGKSRAALFKKGGLSLSSLTDLSTLRPLTLEQLKARHADAFRRAGLD